MTIDQDVMARRPRVKGGGMEVQRTCIDGSTYSQRFVRCGKACNTCSPQGTKYDRERPGHGPYWYRIIRKPGGQLGYRYVGKVLLGQTEVGIYDQRVEEEPVEGEEEPPKQTRVIHYR